VAGAQIINVLQIKIPAGVVDVYHQAGYLSLLINFIISFFKKFRFLEYDPVFKPYLDESKTFNVLVPVFIFLYSMIFTKACLPVGRELRQYSWILKCSILLLQQKSTCS
jgi:hypothetical protein